MGLTGPTGPTPPRSAGELLMRHPPSLTHHTQTGGTDRGDKPRGTRRPARCRDPEAAGHTRRRHRAVRIRYRLSVHRTRPFWGHATFRYGWRPCLPLLISSEVEQGAATGVVSRQPTADDPHAKAAVARSQLWAAGCPHSGLPRQPSRAPVNPGLASG